MSTRSPAPRSLVLGRALGNPALTVRPAFARRRFGPDPQLPQDLLQPDTVADARVREESEFRDAPKPQPMTELPPHEGGGVRQHTQARLLGRLVAQGRNEDARASRDRAPGRLG